ncbi:efflux RND transporter permease subunit, partial [Vogesella mureinivorans]|uniref:efflux RND transporter permease subunit n=1 Tax=Vogesella mureinivorans TaxID=657276 RepID=UPI0011CA0CB9
AVFFPLVFVEGVAGQLFGDQALTVSIAVIISTVVAMALVPMLASLKSPAPLGYPEDPKDLDLQRNWWQRLRYRSVYATLRGWLFIGRIIGALLGAIGRVVLKPYDWLESAYRRALPRALARPVPVLLAST